MIQSTFDTCQDHKAPNSLCDVHTSSPQLPPHEAEPASPAIPVNKTPPPNEAYERKLNLFGTWSLREAAAVLEGLVYTSLHRLVVFKTFARVWRERA